ncbi:MAG: hypothetical protein Q8Q35_01285 [Nanoarchaeota archaeon]|nr:hypothetical protein [Nanoarchaeota archaeon]
MVNYSWECPPRVIDEGGVLNFNVDLKKIFQGERIDKFTELPKIIEFREVERKYVGDEYYKIIADGNAYFLSPKSVVKYGSVSKTFSEFRDIVQRKCDEEYGENKVKVVLFTELIKEYLPLYFSLFLAYSEMVEELVSKEQYEAVREYLEMHVGKIDETFVKRVIVSYIIEGVIIPKIFENPVWINFDEPRVLAEMSNLIGEVEIEYVTQDKFMKNLFLPGFNTPQLAVAYLNHKYSSFSYASKTCPTLYL